MSCRCLVIKRGAGGYGGWIANQSGRGQVTQQVELSLVHLNKLCAKRIISVFFHIRDSGTDAITLDLKVWRVGVMETLSRNVILDIFAEVSSKNPCTFLRLCVCSSQPKRECRCIRVLGYRQR